VQYERRDGLATFSLRVTADGERHRLRLGTQEDGWTRGRADRELEDVLARIRAGVWTPPVKEEERRPAEEQTFHEYATAYLRAAGASSPTARIPTTPGGCRAICCRSSQSIGSRRSTFSSSTSIAGTRSPSGSTSRT
jgi:hypothetical protein